MPEYKLDDLEAQGLIQHEEYSTADTWHQIMGCCLSVQCSHTVEPHQLTPPSTANARTAFPLVYRGDAAHVTLRIVVEAGPETQLNTASVVYGARSVPFLQSGRAKTIEEALKILLETSTQVLAELQAEGRLQDLQSRSGTGQIIGAGLVNWKPPVAEERVWEVVERGAVVKSAL